MSGSRARAFRAFAPVYFSVFLFVAGSSAVSVLVPVYLSRQAHLGLAAIGAVVGVYGIASLAARIPVGLLYSAGRGRGLLVGGGLLSALAFGLVPLVHGTLALTVLMALNGLGWSIATTAQLALLVARPPLGASTAVAMGWFSGATGLGNAVAGIVGGSLADAAGLRVTFFVLAATPLVGAIAMWRSIGAAPAGAPMPPRVGRRLAVVRMPLAVWVGVLVMFFINCLNSITNTFQPVLALGAGLSLTQIGVLSSIRSWASSSSRFGSGPLFARFDPAGFTMPLVVAGTLATCFIPSVIGSFVAQIPLFVIAGLSRGLLRVTGTADAFDAVGQNDRQHGLTSAFLYGGLDVGKIVGPVAGGVVAGAFGIATMLRVLPFAFLLLYLALAVPARRAARPVAGMS
ncbi:MAG TPA: MFS transporter [Gaiellaceae bacterium]